MQDKKDDDFFEEGGGDAGEQKLLELLEKYDAPRPREYRPGDSVKGVISRVSDDAVYVKLDGKIDGVLKRAGEDADGDGRQMQAGEEVELYVASVDGDSVLLSTSLAGGVSSATELRAAMEDKLPLQGKVTGINKGGLQVKVMGVVGFCPASQVDVRYVEDLNEYLGRSMTFVITRVEGKRVVVSRIPVLEQELEEKLEALQADVDARRVHVGTITRIADFGLFVDTGCGVDGLVHVSEVSWARAEKLSESFTPGQQVEYVVLGIERKGPVRNTKVSLSLKQALEDPWLHAAARFGVGSQVEGTITRCAPFGAFVSLADGIEGLIHVSELSWDRSVRKAQDIVESGQRVRVTILSVDQEARRISCSLKDVDNDPWKDVLARFPKGSSVEGHVASRADYGYFVDLASGVTGLLAMPNISPEKRTSIKVGQTLTVAIADVDPSRRRISLSLGMEEDASDAKEMKKYLASGASDSQQASGSSEFGEALREALTRKNRQ
jgi:small subunit ribosomal protein S1